MNLSISHIISADRDVYEQASRIFIGFSGGLDSSVMSYILAQHYRHKITLVHLNHGISEHANDWQKHCENVAANLHVEFIAKKLNISKPTEDNMRKERYAFFEDLLQDGDILVLAHHAQDQLETILFRLFRGHHITSLTGMPRTRKLHKGQLIRPLLSTSLEEIQSIAISENLEYIQDESNQNTKFDRNYIRHAILPCITERWPNIDKSIFRLMEQIQSIKNSSDIEWKTECQGVSVELSCLRSLAHIQLFQQISEKTQDLGGYIGHKNEHVLIQAVFSHHHNSNKSIINVAGLCIRIWKDRLFIYKEFSYKNKDRIWNGKEDFVVEGVGILKSEKSANFLIKFMQTAEKVTFSGQLEQSTKELMRSCNIAPWLRHFVPVVYLDGVPIHIAGVRSSQEWDQNFHWRWMH